MTETTRPAKVLLFSPDLSGHRASFVATTSALLDGQTADARTIATDRRPALFLMIEDGFARFVLIGLWRSLSGRVTAGFLFRPLPAVNGTSLRLRVKRTLLKLLRHLPSVRVLTIFPIPLVPAVESIADGWIYDFQLWDIGASERTLAARLGGGDAIADPAGKMFARIRTLAGQRRVLVALGIQSKAKGFPMLAAFADTAAADDWLIVTLGKVAAEETSVKTRLESLGHLVVDRFVTDEELISAYAAADAVWCLYDPAYDQASGILGRALQFGIPPIVRDGSLSHKLCVEVEAPHLAARDVHDCVTALQALPRPEPDNGKALALRFRETSMASLTAHLSRTAQRP